MARENTPKPSTVPPAEAPMPQDPQSDPTPAEDPQVSDPAADPAPAEYPGPSDLPEDPDADPFDNGNFPV
ncbi:MAG: hypothetical protein AB8B82_05445 [Roseovarius sp.]